VALAPCLLGYGVLAEQLHKDPRSVRETNPYWKWIENYVAEDYVTAMKTGKGKCGCWLREGVATNTEADNKQNSLKDTPFCKGRQGSRNWSRFSFTLPRSEN